MRLPCLNLSMLSAPCKVLRIARAVGGRLHAAYQCSNDLRGMPNNSPVPTAWRKRVPRGLGRLCVLAAAFGLLGTVDAAGATYGAGAFVHGATGTPRTFSAAPLHQGSSLTCTINGQSQTVFGMSVGNLVSAADFDGSSATVTVGGSPVSDPAAAVVFSNTGSTAGYCDPALRALRRPLLDLFGGGGGSGAATADPAALTLTIAAARNQVAVGEPVYLSAQVAAPAGAQLSYSWSYGDGATSTLATPPPHAYEKIGDYVVVLTVSDGSAASRATLAIQVVNPGSCVVPNLKHKSLTSARRALTRAHCRLGPYHRRHSSGVPKGRVLAQLPAPGTVLTAGATVKVTLSAGPLSPSLS